MDKWIQISQTWIYFTALPWSPTFYWFWKQPRAPNNPVSPLCSRPPSCQLKSQMLLWLPNKKAAQFCSAPFHRIEPRETIVGLHSTSKVIKDLQQHVHIFDPTCLILIQFQYCFHLTFNQHMSTVRLWSGFLCASSNANIASRTFYVTQHGSEQPC